MTRSEQMPMDENSAAGFVPGAADQRQIGAARHASMPPLASAQQEILDIMEGRWSQADDDQVAQNATEGLGKDVVLAMAGAGGIVAGLALLFFATAVGAVVLVLGCVTCAFAFEHALVADTAAQDAAADVPQKATVASHGHVVVKGVRNDN